MEEFILAAILPGCQASCLLLSPAEAPAHLPHPKELDFQSHQWCCDHGVTRHVPLSLLEQSRQFYEGGAWSPPAPVAGLTFLQGAPGAEHVDRPLLPKEKTQGQKAGK